MKKWLTIGLVLVLARSLPFIVRTTSSSVTDEVDEILVENNEVDEEVMGEDWDLVSQN